MLKGKHIILGISGGIAAYKSVTLLRLLIKAGAEVQVVITPSGKEFITPVTLSALSSKPVVSEFFTANTGEWHSHVDLGLWADAMVIAPATASSIAKMANGVADNMLITTYLSAKAPVFIAPAMDLDMMAHPSTTRNIELLKSYGNHIIEPAEGELASHLIGKGRMEEPEAIIEYLNDLANTTGIDLLMLTHNFDFYRTIKSRLGVMRSNCFIAQRNEEGVVSISEFKYQNDFFKQVIIANINDGNITTDEKKKLLFSSIPFYRNLCEYSGEETAYNKLTCFLHLKTNPMDTTTVKISDLWDIIKPFVRNVTFSGTDESYYDALIRIANGCVADTTNEVLLDNKLVIAIAIRLCAEKFLQQVIISNGETCVDATSNQTRTWFSQAAPFLTPTQKDVIEEVNLITPESIHINSFMFEPLIDISDWTLKELYNKVATL